MKRKVVASIALGAVIASAGIFIYSKTPAGLHWADALHYWLHNPAVGRMMEWAGLSEEAVMAGQKIYWCPMHPQVRRDKPGLCPICNMRLVEMKEGEGEEKADGTFVFTSQQIQQAGVRFATVDRISLAREIETTGRVDVDERLLKTVSIQAPGRSRIEKLYVNFTGRTVKKDEPLFDIYNPELVATQEEYLALLGSGGERLAPLARAARVRLARWGIGASEMERMRRNGKASETLTIYSPLAGVVIERLVSDGEYVTEGQPILKLADLSRVWIYADVYESELPSVKVGMAAKVTMQGKTIGGKVGFIDPVVDTETRTARVRFDVSNKNGSVKPGMFANVRIRIPGEEALAIPESAIILTGRRAVAFVSEGEGRIRPVEVKLGRKWLYHAAPDEKGEQDLFEDDERYHEVLSGLSEGQKIVVSANFLVAAEAQFQGALEKLSPPDEKGEARLSSDVAAAFAHILESYEKIRKALALDDFTSARKAAAHLLEDVNAVMNKMSGEIKASLEKIKDATNGITRKEADIENARDHFADMSQQVISLASRYGLPEGITLSAFVCPMAKGYGGWLQPGKTVENPYMGRKMSTCGAPLALDGEAEP